MIVDMYFKRKVNEQAFDTVEKGCRVTRRARTCRWSVAWLALLCVFGAMAPAAAQTGERTTYNLGTAGTGGVSHPVGVTLAALIKLKLLPSTGIDVNARNTDGSSSNAPRLRQGDLDFAILTNLDAYNASHGMELFQEQGPDPSLRHLTNLWQSTYYFIVKSDLAPTGRFADLLNLEGRRMAFGRVDSTALAGSRALFDAFAIDIDDMYELEDLDDTAAAAAFLEGGLDGFLLVEEGGGGELLAFLEQAADKAVILDIGDDRISAANDDGPNVWSRTVIAANSYPGLREDLTTVAMNNILGTRDGVDDGVVYQITKTVFDNLPFLQEMHAATIGIDLENALAQLTLPVHPGAAAYYREVGVDVPEPKPVRVSELSKVDFLTRFATVDEARTRLNNATVTVLGGRAGQTIARMTSELADGLMESDVRVIGMTSPEPADNIADVLYARGVDSAVVPLDILNYAREQEIYPGMRSKLVYTAELFPEELHLITTGVIEDIEDLVDKPVSLGPRGSNTEFTASFLFDRLNIPVEPVYEETRLSLERLKTGELAAVIVIGGKPMPMLQEIQADDQLRLLSVPPLEGEAYRPAVITRDDYPTLLSGDGQIETFGVRNVLITYKWRSDNPRYDALSIFTNAFFSRLPALKENSIGHHPKWTEIDPYAEIEGWERSPAARNWLQSEGRPAETLGTADG